MSAGKKYDVALNKDYDDVKVAADYDETVNAWVMNVRPVQQMEYYGRTESDRPAANSVPVGAVYMAVDEGGKTWQSNGIDWVVF